MNGWQRRAVAIRANVRTQLSSRFANHDLAINRGHMAYNSAPKAQIWYDKEAGGGAWRGGNLLGTYGARPEWYDLLAESVTCGLDRIERLMPSQGFGAGAASPSPSLQKKM